MTYVGTTIVHRLHLTDVTPAPELPWARPTYPVFGYLVTHRDGPIMVDTGVGIGHPMIDQLYSPAHRDLDAALARHGVHISDVSTVVCSHLHFDHCGQNLRFTGSRVVAQRAEVDAAQVEHYTLPEWAFPPGIELVSVDGEHELASGVSVIPTPGHTPGHQSVLIEDADSRGLTVICAQASWDADTFAARTVGDEHSSDAIGGDASVARLRSLRPARVLFSHDHREWTPDD